MWPLGRRIAYRQTATDTTGAPITGQRQGSGASSRGTARGSGARGRGGQQYPEAPVYTLGPETVDGTVVIGANASFFPDDMVEVASCHLSPREQDDVVPEGEEPVFESNGRVCVCNANHECVSDDIVTRVKKDAAAKQQSEQQRSGSLNRGYIVFSEEYLAANPHSSITATVQHLQRRDVLRNAARAPTSPAGISTTSSTTTTAPSETTGVSPVITPPVTKTEPPLLQPRFRLKTSDRVYGTSQYSPCVGDHCFQVLK